MMVLAKFGFCIVLMGMVLYRFFTVKKKMDELHTLLIASGLTLVLLPQSFISHDGLLHVVDIMGLIITLVGVGFYIFKKFMKKKTKSKTEQKEKKH